MSFYITCPHCGAHLDPGERCDCQDKKEETAPRRGPGKRQEICSALFYHRDRGKSRLNDKNRYTGADCGLFAENLRTRAVYELSETGEGK